MCDMKKLTFFYCSLPFPICFFSVCVVRSGIWGTDASLLYCAHSTLVMFPLNITCCLDYMLWSCIYSNHLNLVVRLNIFNAYQYSLQLWATHSLAHFTSPLHWLEWILKQFSQERCSWECLGMSFLPLLFLLFVFMYMCGKNTQDRTSSLISSIQYSITNYRPCSLCPVPRVRALFSNSP